MRVEIERHWWKAKLVKGGVYIPVLVVFGPPLTFEDEQEVWGDRSWRWQCRVRLETTCRAVLMLGENNAPVEIDGVTLRNIEPINEWTYRFMMSYADWATKHHPDLPEAQPTTPVDWAKMKPAI